MSTLKSKRYLLAIILGLGAFLIGLAVVYAGLVQWSREVPASFTRAEVTVLSPAAIELFEDAGLTTPLTNIDFRVVDWQPPVDRLLGTAPEDIFFWAYNASATGDIPAGLPLTIVSHVWQGVFNAGGDLVGSVLVVADNDSVPLAPGTSRRVVAQFDPTDQVLAQGSADFTLVVAATGETPPTLQVEFLTEWGTFGTGNGQFNFPSGVAVDRSGRVYVTDQSNHRVQVFTGDGAFLGKWGSQGTGDGQFNQPLGIAADGSGRVYVTDYSNHRVQVFDADGAFLDRWGSQGAGDGQFNLPSGIAVDGSGRVYVADLRNHRLQVFTGDGALLGKWGSQGTGDGQFNQPLGIAADGSGRVYVTDYSNHRVQVFDADGAFLSKWGTQGTGDNQFNLPIGIAVDGSGRAYVADSNNYRAQVFGAIGNFLGKWGSQGTGDGQFNVPNWIAVDGSARVYVTDSLNHRVQVFSVTEAP